MLRARIADSDDPVDDGVSAVCGTGVNGVDVVDAPAHGKLFDDSDTHHERGGGVRERRFVCV